ncbi:ATP-binding protein [Roseateles sp. DB2]|uniref:ATP-binding protein n=1 Tax=Roseateles sp. DB2 TaxID=3453717 RepID=UPI003EEB8A57
MLHPRSLQARLLALMLGLVLGLWALSSLSTGLDARHELDELLDAHLAQAAALLVARQSGVPHEGGPLEHRELRELRPEAPSLHRYASKVAFQVFHEGQLVLRSANAPTAPMLPLSEAAGFRNVQREGRAWRVFATQGAEGDILVLVGEQLQSRADILRAVLRGMLWPLLLALPLLALGLWWGVHRGMSPLRELGRQLRARSAAELQPLHLPEAPLEMQPLLEALNTLFARIQALMESERRFTADAAHELRTPIAAIRTQAQVALAAGEDEPTRARALQATLVGCDRASRLVEQLLTLARLEAGQSPALQPLDLAALARQSLAEQVPRALQARQQLALDGADAPRVVRGDSSLLAALLRNLLDNALRYSPPGARVHLQLAQDDGEVLLTLEDSGPGLEVPALARLGERFFRQLGTGQDGSGLGWSIVRRIAAVHDARLAVDRSPALGGLRVRLYLPASH